MTKAIGILMTLLGMASAQIDRTCIDIAFNSETNTLSGKCQPRDNSGYIPSELDLNDCFGYDGTNITSEKVAVPLEAAVAHENHPYNNYFKQNKTRNMSSDHEINQIANSLSSTTMTSQKPQKLKLEHLPAELLFQISDELAKDPSSLSAHDCIELSVYSHALSCIYVHFYYLSDNYCAFRAAVRNADVEAMDRCAKYGGAHDTTWELPKYDGLEKGCQCIAERPHTQHRPIDELLESVYLGETPIGKCVEALEWLLERTFDMTEQKDQPWYAANDYCDHIPEFLLTILSKSPDRVRTEGICQMIKILHSHGYSLPFHMNFDSFMSRSWGDLGLVYSIMGPLDVALRSHCPPYILELVLRDYMRRLVGFEVTYHEGPSLMQRWAGQHRFAEPINLFGRRMVETANTPWWKFTNVLSTIWGLFLDLMDSSTSWAEEYRGEAADIFEMKIEILIKYQVLNQQEEAMLRGIVTAMRSMTFPTKAISIGVVDDLDSQRCWEALYSVIIPYEGIEEHWILDDWDLIDPHISIGFPHECHRFNIDPDYNVYKMYHDYQMQNDQIRSTLNRPWDSEGVAKKDDGKWVDRE
ncbi:hypothetical protein FGADI_8917 [Fusarium gaditjirri]|uniref:F-box domain-containing protein n=1 Tax=Fusarium gaditjirri TaxID=282569 RepID=A0A8H4T157_9HYPO|nr:hypothetical protein FGADI_8917 [Fusarium gaditjirri]